jgi:hypothetical protein
VQRRGNQGCWFCTQPTKRSAGGICSQCDTRLQGLADFIQPFDGLFIVLTPPHEKGCICEWCNAVQLAERRKRQGWKPIPPRNEGTNQRQEAPNERPFVPVVRINEVAVARNRKKKKAGRYGDGNDTLTPEEVPAPVHTMVDYFPSYESVLAVADRFPRLERPRAKTSGCWWCMEEQRHGELCGVCTNLWADYTTYLDQRPAVEI